MHNYKVWVLRGKAVTVGVESKKLGSTTWLNKYAAATLFVALESVGDEKEVARKLREQGVETGSTCVLLKALLAGPGRVMKDARHRAVGGRERKRGRGREGREAGGSARDKGGLGGGVSLLFFLLR